jgi:hypothetical protein
MSFEKRLSQLHLFESNLGPGGRPISFTQTELINKTKSMIFEFREMEQAKAFTASVKRQFNLDGRVFDDADAAARAHEFPWVQFPPVVHIARPWWSPSWRSFPKVRYRELKWARDEANNIERQVEKLALQFGGTFVERRRFQY